ncbi:MAG TPA: TIGR04190 family B12-binding domain/radical SAM domain protein [Methanomassiliicoccales archaeon]|nr:TIGR04190 family B12-binding domain/radical SAM domain protein [Methanomassiliicoccales archaeon]
MSKYDLVLLHPPAVYDFRKRSIFYGPVSDVVPSTPIFEMYPFGFITMANHLHKAGYKVRIANLAGMMLNDRNFDVERFLKKMDSEAFGIDLHWLPHAHGSLEIAKLVKNLYPNSKVVMGGFSSTYFHEELIQYPQVDFILRGDSTEIPLCELMGSLEKGTPLDNVPNLSWKDGDRGKHNPMSFVPEDLDYMDIDYGWMIKSVIRYRDMEGFKPWKDWDQNPLTVIIPVKGCSLNCVECGGSCYAMQRFLGRDRPAFRSPEKVAEDLYNIQCYLKAPTFIVGDIRMAGDRWAERLLEEAKRIGVTNHIAFELFRPAGEDLFRLMDSSLEGYSVEISPDSHDENVRKMLGRNYTNQAMESTIQKALENGCERFDLFFMIGLPGQDPDNAMASSEYCRHLFSIVGNDRRLVPYTAPLAPFLDPGSLAFENPDKYGYRVLARTLEEHRVLLTNPSWKRVLSYETIWMSRDQIAETSYDAADLLNQIRFECGQIDRDEFEGRAERTAKARDLMERLDLVLELQDKDERESRLSQLREEGYALMESTICQKRELEWRTRGAFMNAPRVLFGLIRSKRRRA